MKRGILYVAVGKPEYAVLAHFSILTLREHGVEEPVRVLSDLETDLFDLPGCTAVPVEIPPGCSSPSRWVKTRLNHYTVWDQTLFLDGDVVCLRPPEGLWDNRARFAVAVDRTTPVEHCNHGGLDEVEFTAGYCPGQTQWNTGVILWTRADDLWGRWHTEWQRFGRIDQLAFARACYSLGRRPSRLAPGFNNQSATLEEAQRSHAILWHSWADRHAYYRARFGDAHEAACRRGGELRAPQA